MAIIKPIPPSSRYDGTILNLLGEDILQNSFGDQRDFIEYHVYDLNGALLYSNTRYTNYVLPENGIVSLNNVEELSIDIENDLNEVGFETGTYRVVYNFFRKHVTTDENNLFIRQISSDRTELQIGSTLGQGRILLGVAQLINELNDNPTGTGPTGPNAPYFEEFLLNFDGNKQFVGINIQGSDDPNISGFFVKLLSPLSLDINENTLCEIVEERSYPYQFEITFEEEDVPSSEIDIDDIFDDGDGGGGDGGEEDGDGGDGGFGGDGGGDRRNVFFDENGNSITNVRRSNIGLLFDENGIPININLTGRANFNLSTNRNRFSQYYTFSDITDNASDEDFARFLNSVSQSKAQIDIDFTSFDNFIHFSSAKERLNNFKYKIELLESYNAQSQSLIDNNGLSSQIITIENNIKEIKGNFDSYENYLYYTSSSKAWPKSNLIPPYTLYSSTSSEALLWLGSDNNSSIYYGGEILSASQFDNQNPHNLIYTLPGYILDDYELNRGYLKFVNMVGQMFDDIWIYIKALTDLYKSENNIARGISKDLIVEVLESLGFDVNNDELSEAQFYDFLLGNTQNGSIYFPTSSGERLISSSNFGSLPKADIVQEKYKRIFHNLSYLYKTKGTLRGLKSLISTFGIPSDLVTIEENSNSYKVKSTNESYEKFHYSLNNSASRIEIPWLPLQQNENKGTGSLVADAIEFMFNDRNNYNSGSYLFTVKHPLSASFDFGIRIDKIDDINGKIIFLLKNQSTSNYVTASVQAPIYNFSGSEEGWWNVLLTKSIKRTLAQSGSSQTYTLYLKKKTNDYVSHQYSASLVNINTIAINRSWTNFYSNVTGNIFTSSLFYLGSNNNSDYFSGSFMELRYWSNPLSESAFNFHVLNPESIVGNNLNSSYNDLALRLPLGSDTIVYQLSGSNYSSGYNGIDLS